MNERLGRGLSALIPQAQDRPETGSNLGTLPIEQIKTNPYQPRRVFDPDALQELAESIKANGIIQPLIVNKTAASDYELIAGERRLQAARLAGLESVPVVIRSVSQKEQLQLAIVENVQREDLDPIEEACAYQTLADDFKLTHQEVAQIVSRDRATVSNSIRLLKLPLEVQSMVSSGLLSPGHARAVLAVGPELQALFAQYIIQYRLNVRQAEAKAKTFAPSRAKEAPANREWSQSLERELSGAFGLKAKVSGQAAKGKITLSFSSAEELARLQELLKLIRKDI
jgi:ParB family chromosome partitioning protein